MRISIMSILHSAVRNTISLYQPSLNELKNKNVIKKSIISELAGQVMINCLFHFTWQGHVNWEIKTLVIFC